MLLAKPSYDDASKYKIERAGRVSLPVSRVSTLCSMSLLELHVANDENDRPSQVSSLALQFSQP